MSRLAPANPPLNASLICSFGHANPTTACRLPAFPAGRPHATITQRILGQSANRRLSRGHCQCCAVRPRSQSRQSGILQIALAACAFGPRLLPQSTVPGAAASPASFDQLTARPRAARDRGEFPPQSTSTPRPSTSTRLARRLLVYRPNPLRRQQLRSGHRRLHPLSRSRAQRRSRHRSPRPLRIRDGPR